MMANLKLQKDIMSAYKLPFFAPPNPLLINDTFLQSGRPWMNNFSWINNQSASLAVWSDSLADDTFSTINAFLQFQKNSIAQYRRDMNLTSPNFWISRLDAGHEYVEHLKVYTEMICKLYSVTWRAFERTSSLLKKTQHDLASLFEKILMFVNRF